MRTSILERVSGPLADVLTGAAGAEAILQRLEGQNAFVTALDAARTWFRYHYLFADLLRLDLRRVAPATIPSLHRAAAAWHEEEGDVVQAVRHYQAAGDWAPAGRLLVDNYYTLTMAGRGETLHALLAVFPADAQLGDGNLAAALSIDSILHGRLDEAAGHLRVARRLAAAVPARDGASSTCIWPSWRSSSPAGTAICAGLRKQRAAWKQRSTPQQRQTSYRCRPITGHSCSSTSASQSCGPAVPTTPGSTSRTPSATPAGSRGRSSSSAASRISRSRRRLPASRCRSRSS